MELNYEIEVTKDKILIELKGDLDIYSCDKFKEDTLKEISLNAADIYINADNLVYIDSTGLGALISIYKEVNEHQKEIIIENLKPNVKKIFEITDLDKLFLIKGE